MCGALPWCHVPAVLPGIPKWVGTRKESGAILQPIPTEDPDLSPVKPRLRSVQRPAAAAGSITASLPPAVPGSARPPSLLQLAAMNSSASSRDSITGRKKMVSRPGSARDLTGALGQRPAAVADADDS